MSQTNIIQRRDLEPLWSKAAEVAQHYEKASNCIAAVIGADSMWVKCSNHPKAVLFCKLCKRYYHSASKLAPYESPCADMHIGAAHEARKYGGSHVYVCPIGFFFWTSPFFSGERFAGALTSSGILAVDKQKISDRLFNICKGEVSQAELSQYLDDIPEKSSQDVQVLAQMLLLCAEKVSSRDVQREDPVEYESAAGWNEAKENSPLAGKRMYPDTRYFMDQERQLLASLRRGDRVEAQNIVRGLLDSLSLVSNGNFDYFKLKVIELIVLLSRTGSDSENKEELVEANKRYLKRIMDSKTNEEIVENLSLILERMAGAFFSFQGICHASALRKAERFIWENYTRKVSLKEVAGVSGLSAPYFSTIFKDEMGENLTNYLNRLRVEKASVMLRETEYSINTISVACGFEDQSWFSKIFKSYTGFSPGRYRKHGGGVNYIERT